MAHTKQLAFLTPADLLARGLALVPLDTPPEDVPEDATSCISGQPLAAGYRAWDVITKSTADPLGQFRGNPDGWISENEAICYRNNNPRKGMPTSRQCLVFEDGTYYYPLISRESAAKQGRPCWRDLVREVWPERQGQRMLMLLTTDPKKRLWPLAEVGPLGAHTPVYLYAPGTASTVWCDWARMLLAMDLIEQVYALGFSKRAIAISLWQQYKASTEVGMVATRELEEGIAAIRQRPEFALALLIAQKGDAK